MSEDKEKTTNELWDKLLDTKILAKGWHLARKSKNNFIEEFYEVDSFAAHLPDYLKEISNELRTETYWPKPLIHIEVPKTTLAVRPGSSASLEDRIVLSAIVYLIAKPIDERMKDEVYSYRLKEKYRRNKDSLFKESNVFDIPYLKKRTISQRIDPFESWYDNWPEFDEKSKKSFLEEGHDFMAVSDISAYFENIQIPILRDQLLTTLNNEPKIVNLLASFLESWVVKTHDGRPQHRGIPQGDEIFSFLGNLFLIPLDDEFRNFCKKHKAEYYRYMDDVRIFTEKENEAREAILLLNRELRALHLNVQSAKTKILKESNKEVSQNLIDERMDKLNDIINQIRGKKHLSGAQKEGYINQINQLAKQQRNEDSQSIIASKKYKPFKDALDSRFFRRWISAHIKLKSNYFTKRLIFEIINNPDIRITSRAISTIKTFPRHTSFSTQLFKFIKSDLNIFPHQESEIIRSFRYLSVIPENILEHCKDCAFDTSINFYIRIQSFYLLSRIDLSKDEYEKIYQLFETEPNQNVQVAMAGNMIKYKEKNREILQKLAFHPKSKVRKVGRYFYALKWNKEFAIQKLRYLFKNDNYGFSMKLCDNMPILYLLTYNRRLEFIKNREELKKRIELEKDKTTHIGHRCILNNIHGELSRPITNENMENPKEKYSQKTAEKEPW